MKSTRLKAMGIPCRQGWVEVAPVYKGYINVEAWNIHPDVDISSPDAHLNRLRDQDVIANTEMELNIDAARQLAAALLDAAESAASQPVPPRSSDAGPSIESMRAEETSSAMNDLASMTIEEALSRLAQMSENDVLVARPPFTPGSEARFVGLTAEHGVPQTVKAEGFDYVLGREDLEHLLNAIRNKRISRSAAAEFVIHFATLDAYPAWIEDIPSINDA